ncbi:unnamed protein product, partial [Rotaria sp. Silwood1]
LLRPAVIGGSLGATSVGVLGAGAGAGLGGVGGAGLGGVAGAGLGAAAGAVVGGAAGVILGPCAIATAAAGAAAGTAVGAAAGTAVGAVAGAVAGTAMGAAAGVTFGGISGAIATLYRRRTVDHVEYIQKVLPIALKYGNETLGEHWTFQQDGVKPHIHHLTQKWCQENFPSFIDKDHWPPNNSDLNPLDYCIWNEFAQYVNWEKVTSKSTLIDELKRAVKKIRQDVVLQNCSSWAVRLQRVLENDRCYLKQ